MLLWLWFLALVSVGVCLLGSGLRAKVFLSLALVSRPGWASVTSSGFRARVGFFG